MLTPEVTVELGQSNASRFLDCAADYLDASGFMAVERDTGRIVATKHWPASSQWGTLATLAPFHSAVIQVQGARATIGLGIARSLVVTSLAMFALCMAGLWWLPLSRRGEIGIIVVVFACVGGTCLALVRAKMAFAVLARQCARQP